MKKEIAYLWADALSSGLYWQGKGFLRDFSDNFCCLGVLCNLHAQAHPEEAARQISKLSYMGAKVYPPTAVHEWAGLVSANFPMHVKLVTKEGASYGSFAAANDSGVTFDEIADFIRRNWEQL